MGIALHGKPLTEVSRANYGFIFLTKKDERGCLPMCMKNNQPVSEYNSPCSECFEYLNSCLPVIVNGFIFGECDLCYCEWCSCYDECMSMERN